MGAAVVKDTMLDVAERVANGSADEDDHERFARDRQRKGEPEVSLFDTLQGPNRAGYGYPCALHKGPLGDCNEQNCRCF
jgi:hypothetical protein